MLDKCRSTGGRAAVFAFTRLAAAIRRLESFAIRRRGRSGFAATKPDVFHLASPPMRSEPDVLLAAKPDVFQCPRTVTKRRGLIAGPDVSYTRQLPRVPAEMDVFDLWRYVDTCKEMTTLRHMPSSRATDKVLRLARRRGSITRSELIEAGIHTQTLSRLVGTGALERVSRGRYRLPDAPITENHGLAVVAAAVPKAVICLVSALRFHDIGTQAPFEVWVALDRRSRRPALAWPRLRVHRFGGKALTEGIETHHLEGEQVRIYNVAKTLADVFKYRNKIGLDVALEALQEAWRARRFTMDDIHRYARVCRVERVMRPYLEALVG